MIDSRLVACICKDQSTGIDAFYGYRTNNFFFVWKNVFVLCGAAFRCELMTGLHPRWSIAVAGGIVLRSVDRKLFIIILIGKHIDSGSNAVVSKCL